MSGARILVVDDDESVRKVVRETLDEEGYETFEAADGVEALQVFERESPDLVILDIMMPVFDGFQVLERRFLLPTI